MDIRKLREGEEPALWALFRDTLQYSNIKDYKQAQINAWSGTQDDAAAFMDIIRRTQPYVVVLQRQIVAYADVQSDGYIDHFFVHHGCQGRGIGRALFETLKQSMLAQSRLNQAEPLKLYANVSITAKPFFLAMGFCTCRQQQVSIRGENLLNYRMECLLN